MKDEGSGTICDTEIAEIISYELEVAVMMVSVPPLPAVERAHNKIARLPAPSQKSWTTS